MPVYEYECTTCGAQFERLQRFSDAPPAHCPMGHNRLRKLLSPPVIIFKGSGFYSTDSRGKDKGETCDPQLTEKSESAASKNKKKERSR